MNPERQLQQKMSARWHTGSRSHSSQPLLGHLPTHVCVYIVEFTVWPVQFNVPNGFLSVTCPGAETRGWRDTWEPVRQTQSSLIHGEE